MTLVGYWPLNEDSDATEAKDHSGNENHGTINDGGDSTVPGANGILGQKAYSFDGSDGNIRHDYSTSKSFTVNMWIKSGTSNWTSSGCGWSDRSSSGFILHPRDNDTTWSGYVLSDSFNDFYRIAEISIPDITNWHMYTITHDNSSNTSRMFLDGRKVAQASTTTSRAVRTNTATIGHDDLDSYSAGERPLNGKISEARYYTRPLTASEIQYFYNASKRGQQTTSKKTS